MQPPPIRAITFDLDDTLWDIWPIIDRAEQRLHAWLTEQHPELARRFTPKQLRRMSDEVAKQQPHLAHDRTTTRKQALKLAAQRVGLTSFCEHTAFDVFYKARNEVEFHEEVLPALRRLAEHYTLGALSNGNADIKLVGLGDLFAFSINAIDVGRAKPEPAMFEAAVRLLELQPAQIVHVGDEPVHDVQGAARAGLRTVWINRQGRSWPKGPRPDAEIRRLDELEAVLAAWEGE